MSDSTDFLQRLYPGGPWCLSAATPERDKLDTRTFSDPVAADAWIAAWNGQRNLYFHVNPPRDKSARSKLKRTDVAEVCYLHVDIDPPRRIGKAGEILDPRPEGEVISEFRERTLGMLEKYKPAPTIIINSGNGLGVFWKLESPIPLDGTLPVADDAALYNYAFSKTMAGGDACHNVDRLMRLPGTWNIPGEPKNKKGYFDRRLSELLLFDASHVHPISIFKKAVPDGEDKQESLLDQYEIGAPVQLKEMAELNKWNVPTRVQLICARGHDPDKPKRGDNSRSAWAHDAVCNLIRFGVPNELIMGILLDKTWGISESFLEDASPEGKARRQLHRALRHAKPGEHSPANKPDAPAANPPRKTADPHADASDVIDEMNSEYFVVDITGKTRIGYMREQKDARDRDIRTLHLATKDNFFDLIIHPKVPVYSGTELKMVPRGVHWFNSDRRRQYKGLVFKPESTDPDYYNLWTGFGVEPVKGDWSLIKNHIIDVVASGDMRHAEYVLKWCAWAIQNPGRPAGTVLVLRGEEGTGKGTFVDALLGIFGQHGRAVQRLDDLTGKFNAHLHDCSLLFCDEAICGSDKAQDGPLKALITEPKIPVERKGFDKSFFDNCLHIIMASNSFWVVPAGPTARRYVVLDVSNCRMGDEAYFNSLYDQIEHGGLSAMLYDLQQMDLGDWKPSRERPKTEALAEQQMESLRGAERRVYNMLKSGIAHGFIQAKDDRIFISTSHAKDEMGLSKTNHEDSQLLDCFRQIGGMAGRVRVSVAIYKKEQLRGFWLPRLSQCRKLWIAARNMQHLKWPGRINQEWDATEKAAPGHVEEDHDDEYSDYRDAANGRDGEPF